jgi:hypothetical protein
MQELILRSYEFYVFNRFIFQNIELVSTQLKFEWDVKSGKHIILL